MLIRKASAFIFAILVTAMFCQSAKAMYMPEGGRFCSRDPIGYADGESLYVRYFSQGNLDPSGGLTISAVRVNTEKPKCGKVKLQWRLRSDDRIKENVIVQRICFYIRNVNCNKNPSINSDCCDNFKKFSCQVCFFEIVQRNAFSSDQPYSYDSWATRFVPGDCGNKGRISIVADVRAFPASLRDTILGEEWDESTNQINCVLDSWSADRTPFPITTGSTLSGDSNLSWWDHATTKSKSMFLHHYDCCGDMRWKDKQKNTETRTPNVIH